MALPPSSVVFFFTNAAGDPKHALSYVTGAANSLMGFDGSSVAKLWLIGVANGIASLDSTGRLTQSQSPLGSGLTVLSPCTDYVGGTAGYADAIVTVGKSIGHILMVNHPTNGFQVYQLKAGTDITATPGKFRPADWNSSTNAVIWDQLS